MEALLPLADEGEIDQYFGRIGTGKTMAGTRRVLDELMRGQVVYANWKVKWEGYDERSSWLNLLKGFVGLKKEFYYFPKENYHYWNTIEGVCDGIPCGKFTDFLPTLTDCKVHLDEGHVPFDAYAATRIEPKKRDAALMTRHFDRSIIIYSQRTSAVHVALRANVNRFYKCEKTSDFRIPFIKKRFIHFMVTEFQDMTSAGVVDEERVRDEEGNDTREYAHAISVDRYWLTKRIYEAYDTKYLRGDTPPSQKNEGQVYTMTRKQIWQAITRGFHRKKKVVIPAPPPIPPILYAKQQDKHFESSAVLDPGARHIRPRKAKRSSKPGAADKRSRKK